MIVLLIVLPGGIEVGFPHRRMTEGALLLLLLGVFGGADGERSGQNRHSRKNRQCP